MRFPDFLPFAKSIENFEWEAHGKTTLSNAILSKLGNKSYPKNFSLLCSSRGRAGQLVKLSDTSKILSQCKIGVADIWLSTPIQNNNTGNWLVARVYPNVLEILFDWKTELKKHEGQEPILFHQRGVGVELKSTGPVHLPLP